MCVRLMDNNEKLHQENIGDKYSCTAVSVIPKSWFLNIPNKFNLFPMQVCYAVPVVPGIHDGWTIFSCFHIASTGYCSLQVWNSETDVVGLSCSQPRG
jgi:hypothetical protein